MGGWSVCLTEKKITGSSPTEKSKKIKDKLRLPSATIEFGKQCHLAAPTSVDYCCVYTDEVHTDVLGFR